MKKSITLLILASTLATSPLSFATPDDSTVDANANSSTVAASNAAINTAPIINPNMNSVNGVVLSVTGNTLVMQSTATNGFKPESSILAVNIENLGLTDTPRMGTVIEVNGQWDGNLFQAAQVINTPQATYHSNDESYRSDDDHDEYERREYDAKATSQKMEVEGQIIQVKGNMITVRGHKFEYARPNNNTVNIDISQAHFKHGSRDQLAVNRLVEVKGSWNGTTLYATKVEFE